MNRMILKLCCGDWNNASRDKRELSVCKQMGMDTVVMAKGDVGEIFKEDEVSGFRVLRFSTRPLGLCFPASVNRIAALFTWAHYAKIIKPDIISGHNLMGLLIGWMSNIFRKNKAKLVYDSHEFQIGVKENNGKLYSWVITHLERFLIKRCAFSIMVNDTIADEVQKIHNLKERPIVVRSTPNLWAIDESICTDKRRDLLSEMESPTNFVLMYHGGVTEGRGIETLLDIVRINENVCAVILGNGVETYLESLKNRVEQLGIAERVLFHPAVSIEELWKYVGAADVGMILAPAYETNNLYSLPNKFFENIQSENPVICPDYPAMKPIVDQYQIGLTCDPEDIEAVNSCVEQMRTDRDLYRFCKANTKRAKQNLCWEKEQQVLIDAYEPFV